MVKRKKEWRKQQKLLWRKSQRKRMVRKVMAEDKERKDVTVNVTGVSMSGEAEINEHNRPVKSDKEEPEGEKS